MARAGGDVAKKKHKTDVTAAAVAAAGGGGGGGGGGNKKSVPVLVPPAAAAAAVGGPMLNLAAGEEVTGLTKDEMASVCHKLEQFARKNPHRVELATAGGDGGGSRRERRK